MQTTPIPAATRPADIISYAVWLYYRSDKLTCQNAAIFYRACCGPESFKVGQAAGQG